MKKLNLFLILILFGFGVAAQTAYSLTSSLPGGAPDLTKRSGGVVGVTHNARLAIAPYAQVVPNDSYTFIGISHPSLATAHTSIGLAVEAMNMSFTTAAGTPIAEKRAVVFTIKAGETHRIFIVNEGHATINTSNAAINNANTHLIKTADVAQFGSIRVTSIGTHPNIQTHDFNRPGNYVDKWGATVLTDQADDTPSVFRFDNLNQLSMWGVVYQESNGAGFSLEFIGDMHDSSASGTPAGVWMPAGATTTPHNHKANGMSLIGSVSAGAGRGVN